MKWSSRFLIVFCAAVFIFTTFISLMPSATVQAAQGGVGLKPPTKGPFSSGAVTYCDATFRGNSANILECENGYDNAPNGSTAYCTDFYNNNRTPCSDGQAAAKTAGQTNGNGCTGSSGCTAGYCISNAPGGLKPPVSQSDCQTIYNAGYGSGSSGNASQYCQQHFKSLGSSCTTIYNQADTSANIGVSSAAMAYCKGKTGEDYTGCVTGYAGNSCTSFTGTANTDCTDAADAAAAVPAQPDSPSTPTCENDGNNVFQLAWIFCPVINGLAGAVDGIYGDFVQPLLYTQPIDTSNDHSDPTNTYEIWSQFRVYGDIFLVVVLLVIVFGEAIGGGLIDAYSVKKILPRLLVAAVLINLSLYIVAFAVDITNIVGNGVQALIEQPFKGVPGGFSLPLKGVSGDIGVAALVGGVWGITAFAAPLAEFFLLFFLIPAFLTMIAILVTVLLRRGLILFLIFISPVAFVLYCLPNTEKYFRQWWDLLFRTLLVYPIIAVMFAMGNVLSVTIDKTTSGIAASLASLLAMVALFVPLFMIPFSFRIAGGLLGRFHEFATQARQRGAESIKGNANAPDSWRNQVKGKMRMRSIQKGVTGKALATNVIPPTNPFTSSGRQQWRENREARRASDSQRAGQQYAEADAVFQANKGNDQYLLALANPDLAQQRRNEASEGERAAWDSSIAAARITHKSPAVRLQAANTLTSTGFQFSAGQQGYNELAETMANITGVRPEELQRDGNDNVVGATGNNAGTYAQAMNFAQYSARGGGRFDQGGINNGTGYDFESGINKANGYSASQSKPKTYTAGAEHFLGAQLEGAENQRTSDNLAAEIQRNIESGRISPEDVVRWHEELLDGSSNPIGANRAEIQKQLEAINQARSMLTDSRDASATEARISDASEPPAIGGESTDPIDRLVKGLDENMSRRRGRALTDEEREALGG